MNAGVKAEGCPRLSVLGRKAKGSGLGAPGKAWAHGMGSQEECLEIAQGAQRVRIPSGKAWPAAGSESCVVVGQPSLWELGISLASLHLVGTTSGAAKVKSLPVIVAPGTPRRECFLVRSKGLAGPAGDVALLRPQLPASVTPPARHGGVTLGFQHRHDGLDLGPQRELSVPYQRRAAASLAMAWHGVLS